jgi:hypothetical protein
MWEGGFCGGGIWIAHECFGGVHLFDAIHAAVLHPRTGFGGLPDETIL